MAGRQQVTHEPEQSKNDDDRVLALSEEFLERCRRGERLSIDSYAEQYPELAARIREVFPLVAHIENIALSDNGESGRHSTDRVARRQLAPEERLGEFRVIREIGRGGMGIVYEAEQTSLNRRVALKVLAGDRAGSPIDRQRFQREAEAVANLHHTNIVPVFGVGEQDGIHYFAMQLIDGQPLNREFSEPETDRSADATVVSPGNVPNGHRRQPPSPDAVPSPTTPTGQSRWHRIATIGSQVADALHHAHSHGILHRDIKPANLLLDRHGMVWVTDFGLARFEDSDLTAHGDVIGTMRYIAPESFSGQTDERSDTYSLGLTLYELIAGRPAFDPESRAELLQRIVEGDMPPLRKCVADIPRDLATIITKSIELEPQRRYSSAAELKADLERFLRDEPIQARRVTQREMFVRWCRKHKAIAGLSATLAGLLIAVAVAALFAANFFYQSDTEQRLLANSNRQLAEHADAEREKAEAWLAESQKALADVYRENGFNAEAKNQMPLAALWFSEAARLAQQYDDHRYALNTQRAANALRLCPQLVSRFPSGQVIDRLRIHPTGEWLISASQEPLAKDILWMAEQGTRHKFPTEVGNITALAWSPSGELLAAGTATGRVHLFRVPDFDLPIMSSSSSASDQPWMIRELEFSRDGNRLAAIRSKHVVLFSPLDLSEVTLDEYHPNHIRGIGFSDNSRWLYSISESDVCRVFSLETGDKVVQTPHLATASGWTICRPVFDDEDRVVTWDKGVVWTEILTGEPERIDLNKNAFQMTWVPPLGKVFVTGNELQNGYLCRAGQPLEPCGTGNILAAVYSAARNELVSAGTYRQTVVYDMATRKSRFSSLIQPDAYHALEISADGRHFATADYSHRIHIWKYPRKNEFFQTIPVGKSPANGYVNADCSHVLVRRTHENAQVYDLKTCDPAGPELIPEGELIESLWHPDRELVLTLARTRSNQTVIDVWNWKSGERARSAVTLDVSPADSRSNNFDRVVVHPHGQKVAFVSEAGRCAIASLDTPDNVRVVDSVACSSLFAPTKGRYVLLVDREGEPQVSRVAWEGDEPARRLDSEKTTMVQLTHDGGTLVVSTEQGFFLADANTLERTSALVPTPFTVKVEGFSSDRQRFSMLSGDNYVRTWKMDSGEYLHAPVDRAGDKLGLTPDGRTLVIPRRGEGCRIIDAATGTKICPEFPLSQSGYWDYSGGRRINMSSDSRFIVISGTPHIAVIDRASLMPAVPESPDSLIRRCEQMSGFRIDNGVATILSD